MFLTQESFGTSDIVGGTSIQEGSDLTRVGFVWKGPEVASLEGGHVDV